MAFQDDYPELAAMFQKLQDGIQESALVSNSNAAADIYTAGEWLSGIARLEGAGQETIAAGLRMVADAIDPPPIRPGTVPNEPGDCEDQIRANGMTLDEIEAGLLEDPDPPITPEEEAWIAENMGGFDEETGRSVG